MNDRRQWIRWYGACFVIRVILDPIVIYYMLNNPLTWTYAIFQSLQMYATGLKLSVSKGQDSLVLKRTLGNVLRIGTVRVITLGQTSNCIQCRGQNIIDWLIDWIFWIQGLFWAKSAKRSPQFILKKVNFQPVNIGRGYPSPSRSKLT